MLFGWLTANKSMSRDSRYWHCLLEEDLTQREQFFGDLVGYVQEAHRDARRIFEMEHLDPLGVLPSESPVDYPGSLPLNVLQGYFGEILAGLVVENYSPFGIDDWIVPAFLFRFHNLTFERLEVLLQGGSIPNQLPGRTGDDCLAFQFDRNGNVIKMLYCEAKCTFDHSSGLIDDAHEKVSKERPASIPQILKILGERQNPTSKRLVETIQAFRKRLFLRRRDDTSCDDVRYDLVSYVYSRSPIRKETWISPQIPNRKYSASRELEAIEIHIHGVSDLVKSVYGKELENGKPAR